MPGEKLLSLNEQILWKSSYRPQTSSFWWFSTGLVRKQRCWGSNSSFSSKNYHADLGNVLFCTLLFWMRNAQEMLPNNITVTDSVPWQWHPTQQTVPTGDWNECYRPSCTNKSTSKRWGLWNAEVNLFSCFKWSNLFLFQPLCKQTRGIGKTSGTCEMFNVTLIESLRLEGV